MDKKTDSILVSIKKMLGLEDNYGPFDSDVIVHINSALMTLTQLGIGPKEGFMIEDYTETWGQFLTNKAMLGAVKDYVYRYVRIVFDPPTNSFVLDAMKKQLDELGWRLNVQAESVETFDFITDDEIARKRGWPGNDVINGSDADSVGSGSGSTEAEAGQNGSESSDGVKIVAVMGQDDDEHTLIFQKDGSEAGGST